MEHARRKGVGPGGAPGAHAEGGASDEPSSVALTLESGALGALVVAAFFFAIDLIQGRPLWTPSALGSSLFLGQRLHETAAWHPALVAGYTVLHGAVFVAWGGLAAFVLTTMRRPPRAGLAVIGIMTTALFLLFETSFVAMALVFEPRLLGDLGAGAVAAANLLAAVSMAVFLARRTARGPLP